MLAALSWGFTPPRTSATPHSTASITRSVTGQSSLLWESEHQTLDFDRAQLADGHCHLVGGSQKTLTLESCVPPHPRAASANPHSLLI